MLSFSLFSQEVLKSLEDEYYDFLSLTGIVDSPTLGYKTLSDSIWKLSEGTEHIWSENNLGANTIIWEKESPIKNWFTNGIYQGVTYKIFGPEWYNSYNTIAPYGQNDGALWQGRGYNTSLTTGIRFESYGFKLTFLPQISWMQNRSFKLMDNSSFYTNEYAYIWGYGNNTGVDAPQRFGNNSFFNFDWGDSEIRWEWKNFTIGFGTQSIWLGPSFVNPILHSNNAPTYPKFDFGIRKTNIYIPSIDLNLGFIEARMWIGKLSESDYFDNDNSNNHNQITGMSLYYSPPILDGLTFGINKVCLSKWDDDDFIQYLNPLYGLKGAKFGNKVEDQKISLSADWLIPKGGIDVFLELGIDDHINAKDTINSYATHFWHTLVYSFGIKKQVSFSKLQDLKGELLFEWNNTEMSQDFQTQWPYNFGFHGAISQGYTNKGQWLGSGIGYGGQSQYLAFKLYYPKGDTLLFLHRYNPDNNFLFKEAIYDLSTGDKGDLHKRTWNYYKGVLAIGINTDYFILDSLRLSGGFAYVRIMNPLYNQANKKYLIWNNCQLCLTCKYSF